MDDNAEASEAYNIKSMPTFVFFNNGQEVRRMSGADEAQLRTWVRRLRLEFAPADSQFTCFTHTAPADLPADLRTTACTL